MIGPFFPPRAQGDRWLQREFFSVDSELSFCARGGQGVRRCSLASPRRAWSGKQGIEALRNKIAIGFPATRVERQC